MALTDRKSRSRWDRSVESKSIGWRESIVINNGDPSRGLQSPAGRVA
jgi:hypothetical protein